jgi:hypothetical protein
MGTKYGKLSFDFIIVAAFNHYLLLPLIQVLIKVDSLLLFYIPMEIF